MFNSTKAFSSFSVNDLKKAKDFYTRVLGMKVTEERPPGCDPMLFIHLEHGNRILVYCKEDHVPATFTVLNFPVKNIQRSVKELSSKGVKFEKYEGTDKNGITHNSGPLVAWFKDPAGNFLSVLHEEQISKTIEVKVSKMIPIETDKLFLYFTEPRLLEKWAAPDGMKLRIPKFDAKVDGDYTFIHTGPEGEYTCKGKFKEFIPDTKLIQKESVWGPDGRPLLENLDCITQFRQTRGQTEVRIVQRGFPDAASAKACEESWGQCFDKLRLLLLEDMSWHNTIHAEKSRLSPS